MLSYRQHSVHFAQNLKNKTSSISVQRHCFDSIALHNTKLFVARFVRVFKKSDNL